MARSPLSSTHLATRPNAEAQPGERSARAAGDRLYVVRSGETLWSIAAKLLGDRATPASIQALVDELWRMNASRIGSGSPNVIHAGDRLLIP